MAKLTFFLTLFVTLSIFTDLHAQFSRVDAIHLVMNDILLNEVGNINVYCCYDMKSGDEVLELPDFRTLSLSYSINWVFFVDDNPYAQWQHSCRYIFVDASSGGYNIINDRIPPVEIYSHFEKISQIEVPPPNPSIDQPSFPPPAISNNHLYAVLIIGTPCIPPDPSNQDSAFWNDLSALYTTLISNYGYKKENIFVHYFRGPVSPLSTKFNDLNGDLNPDGKSDIDSASFKQTIHNTFKSLSIGGSHELHDDDQLFIYTSGHGVTDSLQSCICLPQPNNTTNLDLLKATTFAEYVQNIKCGQMIFVMQNCRSGGFKSKLLDYNNYPALCKNRTIQTAVDSMTDSEGERWITNGRFYEFSYYWIAAIRGYLPYVAPYIGAQPWIQGDSIYHFKDTIYFPDSCGRHPDINPDSNSDGVITMEEAFSFANNYDSWSLYGYYCRYRHTSPYDIDETPQDGKDICFKEDLQSMYGLTGIVTEQDTLKKRSYVLGGPLELSGNATVRIEDTSQIYFIKPGNIYVGINASLIPGKCMKIEGNDTNRIIVEGFLGSLIKDTIGDNHFDHSGGIFGGPLLDNPYLPLKMENVILRNTGFNQHQGKSLNIKNSTFSGCNYFISYADSISISKSNFSNTFIYLSDVTPGQSSLVVIDSSTLHASNNLYGSDIIDVNDFDHFYIHDNSIVSAQYAGIGLYDCGHGTSGSRNVFNNSITDCNTGINVYLSNGIVQNNFISNNNIGARFVNRSNTQLIGNPNATDSSETQQIYDNSSYEVNAEDQSLPYYFHYNFIVDEDNAGNSTDPLLYNDNSYLPPTYKIDIQNNCWGHSFVASQDLHTNYGILRYQDITCPGYKDQLIPGPDEIMFNTADSLFLLGNYSGAKLLFVSLIEQYPGSSFAEAAMKNLFSLEQFSGNDYAGLKLYYLTNDSITADTNLGNLGEFLANRCDVKMQNWPQSISWYENRIMNPPSDVDSICAIIDLEALYLLMENDSTKSSYLGKLPQYKPTTVVRYRIYRDSLIALLPFKHPTTPLPTPMTSLKINELLQNNPNPFSTSSDIWYKLDPNCYQAFIKITDFTGRKCNSIKLSESSEGSHKVTIDAYSLNPGIYLYSLEVDGKITDTKKMVVIR
jgi:hypothetical protein